MTPGLKHSVRPPPADAGRNHPASIWHLPFFILFFLWYAVAFTLVVLQIPPPWRWTEGLLLVLGAITSIASLARFLPLQNALAAGGTIVLVSGFIVAVGVRSGLPFGQFHYVNNTGPELFDNLPVLIPLLWMVIVLNCRGVAQLIMRPWRANSHYGFWVIGLTALLAVIVDLGLEPYAVKIQRYWIWRAPDGIPNWYSAPLVSFLGWFVTAIAIFTFTLPWLINKSSVKQPVDVHPLIIWLLLNLYLLASNAVHQFWPAVVVGGAGSLAAAIPAWRGLRHSLRNRVNRETRTPHAGHGA